MHFEARRQHDQIATLDARETMLAELKLDAERFEFERFSG
jgi:hypothetical protein